MQEWTSNSLFNKGKVYIERAFENRTTDLFPTYAALALEFFARTALANVHPALLAAPGDGEHILYAFGYPATATPQSIPTATVYRRLKFVVSDISEDDLLFCQKFAALRNKELHTGELAFEAFSTSEWLPDYYRVLTKILASAGYNLHEVIGEAEARHATELVTQAAKNVKKMVDEKIGKIKAKMEVLSSAELEGRRKANKPAYSFAVLTSGIGIKTKECPACGSDGIISAKPIGATPPRLADGELVSQKIFWPIKFECKTCQLTLEGFEELKVAKLADEIVDKDYVDPVEFFNVDVSDYITEDMIRDTLREDYGNE